MTDRRASTFRALARAHLRTPAERAIFGLVAGAGRRWWTAAGAARAAGTSELEADRTLRRFAAAGIVDQEPATAGRRYRFRAAMDYLHTERGTDVNDEFRDPVCGMPVAADTPHFTEDRGRVVRFCSLPCLARWQRGRRFARPR